MALLIEDTMSRIGTFDVAADRGNKVPRTHIAARALSSADDVLALSSLERAVSGEGMVQDVGAIAWLALRSLFPAESMAILIYDVAHDALLVQHAAGLQASGLRRCRVAHAGGTMAAAPSIRDAQLRASLSGQWRQATGEDDTAPGACCSVALVYDDCPIGVLALFSSQGTFTAEHRRLLSLIAGSLAVSMASVLEVAAPELAAPAVTAAPRARRPSSHLRLVVSR